MSVSNEEEVSAASTPSAAEDETKGGPVALPPATADEVEEWCENLTGQLFEAIAQCTPEYRRPQVLLLAKEFVGGIIKVGTSPLPEAAAAVQRISVRRSAVIQSAVTPELAVMTPFKSKGAKQQEKTPKKKITFRPAIRDVAKWTAITMLVTIGLSGIMSGIILIFLYSLSQILEPVALYDSNGTLARNLTSPGQQQYYVYQRNRRTSYFLKFVGMSLACFMQLSVMWMKERNRISKTSTFSFVVYSVVPQGLIVGTTFLIYVVAFEAFPVGSVLFNGYTMGVIAMIYAFSMAVYDNYYGVKQYRSDAIVQTRNVARHEIQSLPTSTDGNQQRRVERPSRNKRHPLLSAIKAALPELLIFAALLFFVIGILALYRFVQGSTAKMAVYLLALVIKAAGNKLQLHLIHKVKGFPTWAADFAVFGYEFGTALLCRLMLMSIPDESTAILLSVLNCVFELMIRTWCYADYIGAHAKTLQKRVALQDGYGTRSKDGHVDYWRWGVLRVIDSNNDMIVEYVTSVAAAGMLFWLPRTGIFLITGDGSSSEGQGADLLLLLRLVLYQAVPEFVVDTFACALELHGGLSGQYAEYLTHLYRKPASILMKFTSVAFLLAFALGTSLTIK